MKNKFLKHINTFFVVFPMTLIMAAVGIWRNYGFKEGWLNQVINTWSVMFPVAYVADFFVIPVVKRLTEKNAAVAGQYVDRVKPF